MLPKLPSEFQTILVGSFNLGTTEQKATSSLILYDYNDRRAELITNDFFNNTNKRIRQIYYYDKNEFFTIGKYIFELKLNVIIWKCSKFSKENRDCFVSKFNDSNSGLSFFFQLVETPEGFNMVPPEDILHFNKKFPHVFFTD